MARQLLEVNGSAIPERGDIVPNKVVASQGRKRSFRLEFAETVAGVRRLLLVPICANAMSDDPYREILRELSSLESAPQERELFHVCALTENGFSKWGPSLLRFGEAQLRTVYMHQHETVYFGALFAGSGESRAGRFWRIAEQSGKHLPSRLRQVLTESQPTTDAAWWLSALWAYGLFRPNTLSKQLGKLVTPAEQWKGMGWAWKDPFKDSIHLIYRCGLLISSNTGEQPEGEWSTPLSKAEIARRITQNRKARVRDVEKMICKWQMVPVSDRKWTVRLDTLPTNLRRRLEDEPS